MAAKPESFRPVKEISPKGAVFAMLRMPGTRRIWFGGSDFHVYDVDLSQEHPQPRDLGAHESYVTGLAGVIGATAVSGSYDGRLIWWDLARTEKIRTVEAHGKWIRHVAASPDGALVASVGDDMVCRLWDGRTGEKLRELRGHEPITPHHFPSMLYACTFSPDGRYLATGDKVGHVAIWDAATGKTAATLDVPAMYTWDPSQRRHSIGGIRSLAFSPDGSLLSVGGMGPVGNIDHLEGPARVEIFDWRTGRRTHEFPGEGFKGLVEWMGFSAPDRLVALGGANDGFIMIFDLANRSVAFQQRVGMPLHDAAFTESPDVMLAVGHGKAAVYQLS